MAKIPTTKLKIESAIEDGLVVHKNRPYLGLSSIGDDCARKLWYSFRWVAEEEHEPRKERLLTRGHREEPIIVKDLQKAGVITHNTGDDQLEFVTGNGHIKGHSDGMGDNIPDAPKTRHLLEFKTANDKNFKKIQKCGYLAFNPAYKGQVATYMDLGDLKRTLVVVVNKNDDARHYERFPAMPVLAKELLQRGMDIITAEVPFPKIGNATWFACKWCKFYQVCQFGAVPLINCRTCHFADIHDEGKWRCSRYDMEICTDQQRLGCSKHEMLESLRS